MSEEKDKKPSSVSELIQNKFLEQRKIFLWGEVSDRSARDLTEKLLFLESDDPGKEITFYINSPGGSITAGMAIFDTMQLITSPYCSSCYRNGCEYGFDFTLWSDEGKKVTLPSLKSLDSPAFDYR